MTVNGDSLIYGGAFANPELKLDTPTLDYPHNTIHIEFAAPYFDNESANQFQYFMEGFDESWSDWTAETMVNYRKLGEGDYRFHVRARNIYQNVGDESRISLKVLPTWFNLTGTYGNMEYSANQSWGIEVVPEKTEAKYENGLLRITAKIKDPYEDAVELKL